MTSVQFYIMALSYLLAIAIIGAEPIEDTPSNSSRIVKRFAIQQPSMRNRNWIHSVASDDYDKMRKAFIKIERGRSFGALMDLNDREKLANDIIMAHKLVETELGFATPHTFNPSQHLFEVLDRIEKSKLFKLIQHMPKGGVLHAHDTALASTKLIMEFTYRDNLWLCHRAIETKLNPIEFRFSKTEPLRKHDDCQWKLLSKLRQDTSVEWIDKEISEHLTLFPRTKFIDVNDVWEQFMKIFRLLDGLVLYAPVWKDYYYGSLKEFYEDGVQYLEFRSLVPQLYDLTNDQLPQMHTVQIYVETLAEFKNDYPEFIGSKMIYAPLRNVNNNVIDNYIHTVVDMKKKYPDFIGGFDLVGQEDLGKPLKDFASHLLAMPPGINFYFHAAETNWNGALTDENLIDAILLGTKRIGHGFGLIKHPAVLDVIKERNIAIEVNPLSNQVLQLVSDLRNHPCVYLFANNYPVVISSDDPSFWKAKPLSHDFYVAFLGIASIHSDLRLLKQLAVNSIAYSSMTMNEKELAIIKWRQKWDQYIEWVINNKI